MGLNKMIKNTNFIEIACHQKGKSGQSAVGDVFLSEKTDRDARRVCVLADGLGSGIKAHVLGMLTATMAMKFVSANIDMQKASEIIMSTLPVCSKRKIGYSTFTIMDIFDDNNVSLVEYENPPYVFLRNGEICKIDKNRLMISAPALDKREVAFSDFQAEVGDRIVFFSDGVSQSGIGTAEYPIGWEENNAAEFIKDVVCDDPKISARKLARTVVAEAVRNDRGKAKDDISCVVVYFRRPRNLLVMTGPPIDKNKDTEMANIISTFEGKKIICGGTTANIVARETDEKVHVDLTNFDADIPPVCTLKGLDLVTEGTITLSKTAEMLEKGIEPEGTTQNAAQRLLKYFMDTDIIHFVVGTKINDAHQDPNLPVELDIRRNLIRRIVGLLENKYMKETRLQFI